MNEAHLRAEINKSLERLWLWPLTQPNVKERYPSGRADTIIANWRGPSGAIEYKVFDHPRKEWARATFPFSKIELGQRTWLNMATREGRYIFIGLGTTHGTAGAKTNPRLAWVIPWKWWLDLEKQMRPVQASLPLALCSGLRQEIQEWGYVATNLLAQWKLEWLDGEWHFPDRHPIFLMVPSKYHQVGRRDLKTWRAEWATERFAIEQAFPA